VSGRLGRALRFAGVGAAVTLIVANLDPDNWRDLASGELLVLFGILAGEAVTGLLIGFLLGFFTTPRAPPPRIDPSAFD
jgi:hypothetical protein